MKKLLAEMNEELNEVDFVEAVGFLIMFGLAFSALILFIART